MPSSYLLTIFVVQVRADAVLSTAIMGRGEKVYGWLLAGMYLAPFERVGQGNVGGLCIIHLSDKTTTNQRQYSAMLRHRDPLLCPIGSLAQFM